jgi:hypothetical protein
VGGVNKWAKVALTICLIPLMPFAAVIALFGVFVLMILESLYIGASCIVDGIDRLLFGVKDNAQG